MRNGETDGTDKRGGGAKCLISLLTETDGKKALIVRRGELNMTDGGVSVSYQGESDKGVFFTDGNRAEWSGDGEMRARLVFEKDKITRGEFGLPGLNGGAAIETHKIALDVKPDQVSAEVKYTLHFDYGEEKMCVKLIARLTEKTDFFAS
ncbi:MAG: DUF1934 family protein [Candidatus Scatosoma sp.]